MEPAGDQETDILSLSPLLVGRDAPATKYTTCPPTSYQPDGLRLTK